MNDLPSLITLEPCSAFTAGLLAGMAVARGRVFLPTRIVTPRLELVATPLIGWLRWGRTALIILRKLFQEQGGTGPETVAPWMAPSGGENPRGLTFERVP